MIRRLLAAGLLVTAVACRPSPPKGGPVWSVYNKQGKEVLRMKDVPGPITSKALAPPGAEPVMHPFLTATSLDASEENNLRVILDQSKDFNDYVRRLTAAGYKVTPSRSG